MELRKFYPVIVLSDIHLGSAHARITEVTQFLRHINCDLLVLNGDIVDGWQLKKSRRHWKPEHTEFFKVLMKMMEKQGTQIVYIRGNHDDFLDDLIPLTFSNFTIQKEYILHTHGKRYLIMHGDLFDTITTRMRWLAWLGDLGYDLLLGLNKAYNRYRERCGKSYYSLAKEIKQKVKTAVSYISDFEQELIRLAESRGLDGVICGHIHQAANRYYGTVHYLNAGDWVESLTALVQNEQGAWQIVTYNSEQYADVHVSEVNNQYADVI